MVERKGGQQKLKDVKMKAPAVKRKRAGTFEVVHGPSKSIFEAVVLEEGSKRNKANK